MLLAMSEAARVNLGAFLVLAAAGFALLVFAFAALSWLRTRSTKVGLVALALFALFVKTAAFAALFLRDYPAENGLITLSAAFDLAVLLLIYLGIVRPAR